jgi:hypothetical protein
MEEQEVSYKANMGAKQGEIKHLQVSRTGFVFRKESAALA